MASGFSLLPYLTRQQDPFSAVLAGKLAAQKQRQDTVKWLANYQMQLQRLSMSRAASGRAQQMHDMRMKQLRAGPMRVASTNGIGLGGTGLGGQGAAGAPSPFGMPTPVTRLLPGQGIASAFDPTGRSSLAVTGTGPFGLTPPPSRLGGPPQVPNPFAAQSSTPAAPRAPSLGTMDGFEPPASGTDFTDPGALKSSSLDAGIDTKLAALDDDPYKADDEEDGNPFAAFA